MGLEQMWPPFGLEVVAREESEQRQREIRLRVLRDEDIAAIHGVTPAEIYGEVVPEYAFDWLFQPPSPRFRWLHRAHLSPEDWSLDCGVFLDGELIGVVDLRAQDFAHSREVETGSWIYHRHQGKGLGTLVRHAVAVLCFDHLGAETLRSSWHVKNRASAAVSAKLGYTVCEAPHSECECREGNGYAGHTGRLRRTDYMRGPSVIVRGVTSELREMAVINATSASRSASDSGVTQSPWFSVGELSTSMTRQFEVTKPLAERLPPT